MDPLIEQHGYIGDDNNRPESPREKRLREAREKEHVRLAMRSTARYGYYVFDEVITEEAGVLDYLAVGPLGVILVLVRSDPGCVCFGENEDEILLDGKPFEDNPLRQTRELAAEIDARLFEDGGEIWGMVCFTRAGFELDKHRKPPRGTTPILELSRVFNPEEELEEIVFTPADIEEIAEKIQQVYGRPPIVTPLREQREGGA